MVSVHLQKIADLQKITVDAGLVQKMNIVRDICSRVLFLRKEENIRVRMPLAKVVLCGNVDLSDEFLSIIKQEVNVKEVEILKDKLDEVATAKVVFNMKECGKVFGADFSKILQAQKKGEWKFNGENLEIAGFEVKKELFTLTYEPKDVEMKATMCENNNILVMIDTKQTEELKLEGISRDVVRIIQQTRKEKGLEISDRIETKVKSTNEFVKSAVEKYKDYIKQQTLSKELEFVASAGENSYKIDDFEFAVEIKKIG